MPYKDPQVMRDYQRRWMAQRRQDWLTQNGPCVQCGSSDDLEVDHIDTSTKVDHKVWSWAEGRRLAELAKCQVLCSNCHMRKTLEQRPKTEHGRGQMYIHYKCRCDECRAWKSASDKKYRQSGEKRVVARSQS